MSRGSRHDFASPTGTGRRKIPLCRTRARARTASSCPFHGVIWPTSVSAGSSGASPSRIQGGVTIDPRWVESREVKRIVDHLQAANGAVGIERARDVMRDRDHCRRASGDEL